MCTEGASRVTLRLNPISENATHSQISPSFTRLFQSLDSPAWGNVTIHFKMKSNICHISGSCPSLERSSLSRFRYSAAILPILPKKLKSLSFCRLHLALCLSQLSSRLHALSYFSFYPQPHSVFIFQEDIYERVCASAPFSARSRPTSFSPAPQSPPPLVNTDPARGFVLLVFF